MPNVNIAAANDGARFVAPIAGSGEARASSDATIAAAIAIHADGDRTATSDDGTRLADALGVIAAGDGRYPGGKSLAGMWQWVISQMPTHVYYAEPFAGHGGILRRKPPALATIVVDSDPDVAAWWRRLDLPTVDVIEGCGITWLARQIQRGSIEEDWLVYCDPPYPLGTRTKKRLYRQELTDADHRRLLRVCLEAAAAGVNVMVSSYPSRMYSVGLSGWTRLEREVITRGGTMRTECLWTSFEPAAGSPRLTVEYSQLGANFRERERVNRKINRWVSRITAMPPAERRALLLAVLDAGH